MLSTCGSGFAPPNGMLKLSGFIWLKTFAPTVAHTGIVAESPVVESATRNDAPELPENCIAVTSPVSGSVWQIKVTAGQSVAKGETLVILEAMKMEIAVIADAAGTVETIHGVAGAPSRAGDTLLVLRPVQS